MYPLGLGALQPAYNRTLVTPHEVRVRFEVLDLEGRPTGTLTSRALSGQVTVSRTAEVSRALTCTLSDDDRSLSFDSNSPADGAIFADRMMRVWYGVRGPLLPSWVDCPIFTGPVTKFGRTGSEVTLEAQGKEHLARGNAWRTQSFEKGTPKVKVIREVMDSLGERDYAMPWLWRERLSEPLSLAPKGVPWDFVQGVARSLEDDSHLYYDGYGTLRLRQPPETTLWTFTTGEEGSILSDPRVTYDVEQVRNAVKVTGKKLKGRGRKIVAHATAWPGHPLFLTRNGERIYRAEFIENAKIGRHSRAQRIADRRLRRHMLEQVAVEAETFVVPALEEYDPVTFTTDEFSLDTSPATFGIPLVAGQPATLGYTRAVRRPNERRIR